MKIAVTGASGLIGSALVPALTGDGHSVVRLVRRPERADDEIQWDPPQRRLDASRLADVDAVVHLAGVGIGDHRWSAKHERAVRDSRVDGTTLISETLAGLRADGRPRTLVTASAIGWYGDTGDREVDEAAPAGTDVLADVVKQWEAATAPAQEAGVRVVRIRTGLVCGRKGGLLGKVLPLVKLGVGGRLASGRQYWSWISLPDEIGAIRHVLGDDGISGAVNLTGPAPVTNAEFVATLGRILHRPTVLPVPAFALRIVTGKPFADAGIIAGQRVLPAVLQRTGYRFQHETAEQALRWATRREN